MRLITGEGEFLASSTSSFQRTDADEVDRADADKNVDVEDSIYGMGCFSRKKKKGKGSLVWREASWANRERRIEEISSIEMG